MRQVGRVAEPSEEASAIFSAAVAGLRSCQDQVRQIRPELCFEEVPAPRTLAPFATAVGAAVRVDGAEIATGRFVRSRHATFLSSELPTSLVGASQRKRTWFRSRNRRIS